MKKLIPALAVLGSAVAFAVYKLKKDEQRKVMELDQDLLHDDTNSEDHDSCSCGCDCEEDDEEPLRAEPASQPEVEETPVENIAFVKEPVEETPVMEPLDEEVKDPFLEEPAAHQEEAVYPNPEFPHLSSMMINDINEMNERAMDCLKNDGDVHENERPIQHTVSFKSVEDLENFKNKVINKGFVITKGEGDLDLVVLHISPIDHIKLVTNVLYLADQAYENHGVYKGWQSKVSY